jgi:hypothetical protein
MTPTPLVNSQAPLALPLDWLPSLDLMPLMILPADEADDDTDDGASSLTAAFREQKKLDDDNNNQKLAAKRT